MDHRLSDVQKAAVAAAFWAPAFEIGKAFVSKDFGAAAAESVSGYWLAKIDEILSAPEVSVPEAAAERMQRASLSRSHD